MKTNSNKLKFAVGCIMLLLTGNMVAQQSPQYGLYQFNPLAINPAYAGSRNAISAILLHRSQWVGLKGAPMTQSLTAHMPLSNNSIGVGLSVANDKVGSSNTTWIYGDFSYSFLLNEKEDKIAFGLKGGVDLFNADFNGLKVIDATDQAYTTPVNSSVKPNVGFGAYYYGEKHFAGFSVPKLIESKISNAGSLISNLKRHYYLMGGYVFTLTDEIYFRPSSVVKVAMNSPVNVDINASFLFKERLWVGAMFRTDGSVGVNSVFYINSQFYVGYAFEYSTSSLRSYSYGTHELMLGLDLNKKAKAYTSPRFF